MGNSLTSSSSKNNNNNNVNANNVNSVQNNSVDNSNKTKNEQENNKNTTNNKTKNEQESKGTETNTNNNTKDNNAKDNTTNTNNTIEEEPIELKLVRACKRGDLELALQAINQKANVNYVWFEGNTGDSVIHQAVKSRNIELIDLLLTRGADPNLMYEEWNEGGVGFLREIPFLTFLEKFPENLTLISKFIECGANLDAMRERSFRGPRAAARFGVVTTEGALHLAVNMLDVDLVQLLLRSNCDVNARKTTKGTTDIGTAAHTDETALHMLCRAWNTKIGSKNYDKARKIFGLLLAHGADVNATKVYVKNIPLRKRLSITDKNDPRYVAPYHPAYITATSLHLAIELDHTDLVWFLLAAGADADIPFDEESDTTSTREYAEQALGNKAIEIALEQKWQAQNFKYYPKEMQDAVLSFLLVVRRLQLKVDMTIISHILSYTTYRWLVRA